MDHLRRSQRQTESPTGRVPHALGELFKFVSDGSLKVEVTNPLADASRVHTLFEGRMTTGKLVLIP
jgi:NADPH:quinone reductase-like Zn-dependent oxidoreductase